MAVFNVTNLLDMGAGSLRDAINMANSSAGADTIEFDAGLSGGSIGLSSGQLLISDSLTINGLGANFLTVDAQMNNFRVFNITDNSSSLIDVFINDLTITGGNVFGSGGGIQTVESLTITNSTISGNSTGFRGGGIYSVGGDTTIVNSTISGNNSASDGGGIYSYIETINITNSTISGNSAGGRGGGIFFYGSSGRVTNSTIAGNSASSGGGITEYYGEIILTNTIIANNTGGDCISFSISNNNINNLIEDGTCNPLLSGDPNLGPLQNNGGPTETHELLPGSIAIDAGDNAGAAGLMFDQRGPGFDRVLNGTVDIGAVEAVPEPLTLLGVGTAAMFGAAFNVRFQNLNRKARINLKNSHSIFLLSGHTLVCLFSYWYIQVISLKLGLILYI